MSRSVKAIVANALGFPLVTLAEYLRGEAPAAADPVNDALRTKRGKSAPVNMINSPSSPATLGSSLTVNRSAALDVTDADYVSWYIQARTASDTTGARVGFSCEASYDGVDWYPIPLLYTDSTTGPSGAGPVPATVYVNEAGTAAAPDGAGYWDANNTYQRYAMYDMIVRPILALGATARSHKWVVPIFVGPYISVRGVLVPLYTGGGAITGSLVAVKVS